MLYAEIIQSNSSRAKNALLILITRNIQLFMGLLTHLAPRAPAQNPKGNHNQSTPSQSRRTKWHTKERPIRSRNKEDGQQGCDTAQDRARETDQHEEAAGEGGVGEDADAHHPSCLSAGERKRLKTRVVQDWQRDPENKEGECTDEGTKGVCEDHATAGAAACRRAGEALVEDLVEAVEDGADANDEVSSEAVLGFCFGGGDVIG
ncbi:hypothetical protein V495_06484, partial [Pseudogymnoascus sp. VKM F-4514 (FW-929)]